MKIAIAIVLTIILLRAKLNAQENALGIIDNYIILHYNEDTAKINLLIHHAILLYDDQPDSAIILCNLALQKSIQSGYREGIIKSFNQLGVTYDNRGDVQSSLQCYKKALQYISKNEHKSYVLDTYEGLSQGYINKGQYDSSAYYQFEEMEEFSRDSILSYKNKIDVYNSISTFWKWMDRESEKALYYLDKTRDLIVRNNDTNAWARYCFEKANIYANNEHWDSATYYCMQAITLSTRLKKKKLQREATLGMGTIFLYPKNRDIKRATLWINHAIILFKQANDKEGLLRAYDYLGEAHIYAHKYPEAKKIMQFICVQSKLDSISYDFAEAHLYLALLYKQGGEFPEAFAELNIYRKMHDSLYNKAKAQTIYQLDTKYRVAEKDKTLAENQLLIFSQQAKLKEKNLWINSISIGLLLLTASLILLYRNYKHKQSIAKGKLNAMQQKQAIILQEKEIDLLKAMMRGEEEERKRIARELHDGIGGMLAAIKMNLVVLKPDKQKTDADIETIVKIVENTANEVRRTSHNLMPEVLTKYRLDHAIIMYLENMQIPSQLQVDLQFHGDLHKLNKQVELIIYRIIQELVQNIIKHSKATKAEIQITQFENNVSIVVEDNGIGFEPDEKNSGLGLQNLQFRVKALQGDIFIQSNKGSLTTIFIEFDLDKLQNT